MTALLVNVSGLALMAAIVWWFWLSSSPVTRQTDQSEANTR